MIFPGIVVLLWQLVYNIRGQEVLYNYTAYGNVIAMAEVGIDGELFLMLPEDNKLLESLELPYLFKVLIVKKAKEVG